MACWCYGTVSSILLLNTDLAVAPLSLASPGILALYKFDWLIDWNWDRRLRMVTRKHCCQVIYRCMDFFCTVTLMPCDLISIGRSNQCHSRWESCKVSNFWWISFILDQKMSRVRDCGESYTLGVASVVLGLKTQQSAISAAFLIRFQNWCGIVA